MPTTFDGPNKLIILDNPTAGVLSVDVQRNLYSEWKEWVLMSDNSKYLPAFRTTGGDPLTPGVEAGAYFFLFNDLGWRIQSSDEDQTINYSGNLVGEDSSLPIIVATPGRTVLHLGLQPVTQRVDEILTQGQKAEYNGSVTIDVANGQPGVAYPVGTAFAPVNNIADARTIADANNFKIFRLVGTISLDQDYTNWRFVGVAAERSATINISGRNVDGSKFENLIMTGMISGSVEAVECGIDVLSSINGTFRGCGLKNSFQLNTNSDSTFVDCYSEVAGLSTPTCDINGANSCNLRNYSGGIAFQNAVAGFMGSIDLDPGTCIIDNTNTGGVFNVRGTGQVIDTSTAMVTNNTIDPDAQDLIRAAVAGRAVVSIDDQIITLYAEDGVTVLRTLNVTADGRNRTVA